MSRKASRHRVVGGGACSSVQQDLVLTSQEFVSNHLKPLFYGLICMYLFGLHAHDQLISHVT